MKQTGIRITGVKLKDGKLVKAQAYKDVSAKLRERGSKKVRVARRGATDGQA